MAIAVSQAYKDAQAQRGGKRARILVQYKRRYFDATTVAYVYEANWHVLTQRDFVDPSEIVDQLDVQEPNVFKSTTVTLRLNNADNRWIKSINDPSIFAGDAVAPNGYDDYGTIFQLLKGFQLADGTWEDWPQFTGYAFDVTPLPAQGYIEIPVSASLLADKCAATEINVPVTGEGFGLSKVAEALSPTTGDGTTAILKTGSTDVIKVANVYANGVALVLGTDYTVTITADNLPATITLMVPSTWNGKTFTADLVTKDLLTISTGVVSVDTVYSNGVALRQGLDYTVSLPSDATPATVTLSDATIYVGSTLTWSGTKGVRNISVDGAVGLFCDAAGISPSMRAIQPVIFPGGLSGSKTIDTEADWSAFIASNNVTATEISGNLLQNFMLFDDFSDGNYTSNPAWTVANNPGVISASGGELTLEVTTTGSGYCGIYSQMALNSGSWQWNSKCALGASISIGILIQNSSSTDGYPLSGGYAITITVETTGTGKITIGKAVAYGGSIGSWNGALDTNYHTYRVTRTAAGDFKVFLDGILIISASDTSYSAGDYFFVSGGDLSLPVSITNIYYSQNVDGFSSLQTGLAYAEYAFNLLSVPASFGTLDHSESLNGGSVAYYTATAPDSGGAPGTWSALSPLGPSNLIQSPVNQWLKIRVEISAASGTFISPAVEKIVANFLAAVITMALVAPTSGTAFDLIQVYAKMCNYETGWDEFGTFFFRSRTVSGSAVAALDPWTNVISVDDTHPGYDRVANIGLVTATPYLYRYDYVSAGEPEPTSQRRFGPILRQLDFSSVLLANDVQIGLAAAQIAYQDNYRPKWRCRAQVKDMPWLQLSDPVDFTFATDPKMLDNVAGDPLQAPGFAGPQGVALAISKRMKIVGITRKMSACTCDLLLEEILS